MNLPQFLLNFAVNSVFEFSPPDFPTFLRLRKHCIECRFEARPFSISTRLLRLTKWISRSSSELCKNSILGFVSGLVERIPSDGLKMCATTAATAVFFWKNTKFCRFPHPDYLSQCNRFVQAFSRRVCILFQNSCLRQLKMISNILQTYRTIFSQHSYA